MAEGLARGDPRYRRAVVAMVAVGIASFNAMYCTQALMPSLSRYFGASPDQTSLTVGATTGLLAILVLPMSILSERFGRGRVIMVSALATMAIGLALPFAPSMTTLIAARAAQGIAVAGVPATAMAWLAQEIQPHYLSPTMGLYVAGNTLGGLLGRLIPSALLSVTSWRWALGIDMALALACTICTIVLMPSERRFTRKKLRLRSEVWAMLGLWRNAKMAGLFIIAFIFMGAFVSLYNFLGYRLTSDQFRLSPTWAGAFFLLYLFGNLASARTGPLITRLGRPRTMVTGAALCLIGTPLAALPWLPAIIVGVAIFTYGFFTVHSTASGWVGALASHDRAESSGTYLSCYYFGSALIGYVSGHVLHSFGWYGLIAWLMMLLMGGSVMVAVEIRR